MELNLYGLLVNVNATTEAYLTWLAWFDVISGP